MYVTHNPPGTASTQHNSDAVPSQNPGQSREVRVAIRTLLKHPLVQLPLQVKHTEGCRITPGSTHSLRLPGASRCVTLPVWVDSSWRTPGGGRKGDGVWRSSSACSATRPSLWEGGRPLGAAAPAASGPGRRCPPASAPAAGRRGQRATGVFIYYCILLLHICTFYFSY